MHAEHISDALVTNKTGSSITLKGGVLHGTFEVLDLSSTEEPLPLLVAGVNAQNADVTDLTDVIAHIRPHVNVLNYPEAKPALLNLLAQHRQAIALPGKPLGVTTSPITLRFSLELNFHNSLLIGCHIVKGKWVSRRSTNSYKKVL